MKYLRDYAAYLAEKDCKASFVRPILQLAVMANLGAGKMMLEPVAPVRLPERPDYVPRELPI